MVAAVKVSADSPLAGLTAGRSVTSPDLWSAFVQLRAGRPDLQVLSWMFGPDDLVLPWVHSVGAAREPALRALIPALPPDELRMIVAAREDEIFLWTGFVDLTTILDQFAVHQRLPESDGWDVLDFGCGCGRLTRFFEAAPLGWRAHGAEVNAAHVEWCRRALRSVDSRHNGPAPPLSFDAGSMDLAFSVSVFSHLSGVAATAWLADLARILRPGGILVATTHGENVLNTIQTSAPHQEMFRMTPEEARLVSERLRSEGMVYLPYDADVLDMANAGDDYGNAFVSREFVGSDWPGTDFELCAFLPAGLRGWQDMVVLRRR